MNFFPALPRRRPGTLCSLWLRAALLGAGLTAGCSTLLPKAAPPPAFYALGDGTAALPRLAPASAARSAGRTLSVSPLTAAPGFDSARMVYLQQPHQLAHYAQSEWVDTPAHMLAPLVVAALVDGGAFAAVVAGPSGAAADLRLDLALLRLQHDFTGERSHVRLTLRATLVDTATRRVREQRTIDEAVDAPREDAYGGVLAANLAVARALTRLTAMCAEAVAPDQDVAAEQRQRP
jgi:cholesterol transport system auxiliary component